MNIEKIYKDGLCTGCGTCAGMCPVGAIELVIDPKKGIYKPLINNEKCTNCGLCYKVCPGHSVDFKELNKFIFGKQPENSILGSYLKCYMGHSTNYDMQYNSSSGGLVTQLLIVALKERVIDGALVTRMKKDRPLEPEPFIARTKEEIISARCAKYCPVPANIMLKEILNSKDNERFAVVGIPCHIHGIRKAEIASKKLQEKIVLRIGLFCTNGVSFLGNYAALKKMNIQKEKVKFINYRFGNFPPAKTLIELDTNTEIIDHLRFWNALYSGGVSAIPPRCKLCIDQTNELADISIGSGWFPYRKYKQINQSVCISRTSFGETFIQRINSEKKIINISEIIPKDLTLFEKIERGDKKYKYKYLSFFFRLFGKKYSNYNSIFLERKIRVNFKASLMALKIYLILSLASIKYLRGLLNIYAAVKKGILALIRKIIKITSR